MPCSACEEKHFEAPSTCVPEGCLLLETKETCNCFLAWWCVVWFCTNWLQYTKGENEGALWISWFENWSSEQPQSSGHWNPASVCSRSARQTHLWRDLITWAQRVYSPINGLQFNRKADLGLLIFKEMWWVKVLWDVTTCFYAFSDLNILVRLLFR